MSKEFKIILIVCVVVLILCGGIYLFLGSDKTDKGKEKEVTEKTDKELKSVIPKGIQFDAVEMTLENGMLSFEANVINNGTKKVKVTDVTIVMQDKDKNTITKFDTTINETLEPTDGTHISSQSMVDYTGEVSDIKVIYIFK